MNRDIKTGKMQAQSNVNNERTLQGNDTDANANLALMPKACSVI